MLNCGATCYVSDINNLGQVSIFNIGPGEPGVLDSNGTLHPVSTLLSNGRPYQDPVPVALNDVGGVAGEYLTYSVTYEGSPFQGKLAWQQQNGTYSTIYFDGRDYLAQANAINDFDITAGSGGISDLNHIDQAFIVGQYFPRHYLLPVNERQCYRSPSSATSINDSATIVGHYDNGCQAREVIQAVRFNIFGYATPILQSPPPADYESGATHVNQANDIVGYAYDTAQDGENLQDAVSYLYRAASNRVTFLPRPADEPTGNLEATGLNESDQVVGTRYIPGDRFNPSVLSAWLYTGGATYDLNSLLPRNSLGWVIQSAVAINDAGQIVGQGSYRDPVTGELDTRAYVMTP